MDIAYGDDPAQKLDLYPAAGVSPHKLVMFLHGGGFVTGSRRGGRLLSGPLNQAGYTLACLGYRLLPQTDMAGCVADAARAAGFVLSRSKEWQIDSTRWAVMGHSAGALMAALLATDQTHLCAAGVDTRCFSAVIALDGIFDVQHFLKSSKRQALRDVYGNDPAVWEKYSPIGHVELMTADPRFCLMYEDVNTRFADQAVAFESKLRRHKKTVVTGVASGLKHSDLMLKFDSTENPMLQFVTSNLSESL